MARQITDDCYPKNELIDEASESDLLLSNTTSNNNTDVSTKPELTLPSTGIDDRGMTDDKGMTDDRGMTDDHAASRDEAPTSVAGDVIEAAETKQSAAITSDALASNGYILIFSRH